MSEQDKTLDAVKRRHVLAVLAECGGNKTAASAVLGVSLKTIYNLLNRYEQQGHVRSGDPVKEDNQ